MSQLLKWLSVLIVMVIKQESVYIYLFISIFLYLHIILSLYLYITVRGGVRVRDGVRVGLGLVLGLGLALGLRAGWALCITARVCWKKALRFREEKKKTKV